MFYRQGSGEYRQLLAGVQLKTVAHGQRTLMGKFKLSKDAQIPSHSHPHEQTGVLISGILRFKIGDEDIEARPGDCWCIPGGVEHSVLVLEEAVVVEVFSPVREDYLNGSEA
jgi:quercetin dioxygenase-like cupin family protein